MTNPSSSIRRHRDDLTPFLFHYTKGQTPYEVLTKIINEKKLISSNGFISFTEAPLSMSIKLFEYMDKFQRAMYTPYGIGFDRDLLFKMGARPVIYGTPEENKRIPDEYQWRCLNMEPSSYDFSWLREWRVDSNTFDFSHLKGNVIIITKTESELHDLITSEDIDIDWGYEPEIGQAIPSLYNIFIRELRGISLEKMTLQKIGSDGKLKECIDDQIIGETID